MKNEESIVPPTTEKEVSPTRVADKAFAAPVTPVAQTEKPKTQPTRRLEGDFKNV